MVDVELTEADPWSGQGQAATPNGTPPWRCSDAAACPALKAGTGGAATLGADRGLRHARLRLGPARPGGDAPCRPERARPAQRDRPSHGPRSIRATHQSQRRRKRVEEVFGWIKTVGAGGKLRYLGQARNNLWFELTAAAYNLTRLANLEAAAA